jgi:hypothetical protein
MPSGVFVAWGHPGRESSLFRNMAIALLGLVPVVLFRQTGFFSAFTSIYMLCVSGCIELKKEGRYKVRMF